jgi:hypothetical protein
LNENTLNKTSNNDSALTEFVYKPWNIRKCDIESVHKILNDTKYLFATRSHRSIDFKFKTKYVKLAGYASKRRNDAVFHTQQGLKIESQGKIK